MSAEGVLAAAAAIVACMTVVQTAIGIATFFMTREVKHATNSIMTERLAETAAASEAKGKLEERARLKVPVLAVATVPVPVVDDRAAKILERGVEASERLADATEEATAQAKKVGEQAK